MDVSVALVKQGGVRDFDDIYEGVVPDIIAPAAKLREYFTRELTVTCWVECEKGKASGSGNEKRVEFDSGGEEYTRIIMVSGLSDSELNLLKLKFGLVELE